jgi:hypothetical protein
MLLRFLVAYMATALAFGRRACGAALAGLPLTGGVSRAQSCRRMP